jgi:hypothetical protein
VLLLAFALEGQISATHFHPLAKDPVGIASNGADGAATNKDKAPRDGRHLQCDLCKQLAAANDFLPSGASSFSPPQLYSDRVAPHPTVSGLMRLQGLGWQSRAPPIV